MPTERVPTLAVRVDFCRRGGHIVTLNIPKLNWSDILKKDNAVSLYFLGNYSDISELLKQTINHLQTLKICITEDTDKIKTWDQNVDSSVFVFDLEKKGK